MAVNPCKATKPVDTSLFRGHRRRDLPPHVYGLARDAYRALMRGAPGAALGQAIVCTGIAGSGKTESAAAVTAFLAHETAPPPPAMPAVSKAGHRATAPKPPPAPVS